MTLQHVADLDDQSREKLEDTYKKLHRLARSVHRLTDEVRSAVHFMRGADGITHFDLDAIDDAKLIKSSTRLDAGRGLHTPTVGQVKDLMKVVAVASSMLNAADTRIPEIIDPTLIATADVTDLRTWLDEIGRS